MNIKSITASVLMGTCVVSPTFADQHTLQPEFTFKRIGVPSGNVGKRITVQIGPEDRVTAPSRSATPNAAPAPEVELAWFWDAVSPDLADTGPGRLEQAMRALEGAPDGVYVPSPRIQPMQEIIAAHGRDIVIASIGSEISPALVVALISVESSGRVDAVSHAGASGLMQLMPDTAARFGVTDIVAPADNIKGGVAYLSWLMDHFDDDPILALAGYNAGEGAVRDNNGVPPYRETRNYVPKVLAAWKVARGLCQTPPELVSDGCAFAISG